MKEQAEIPRPSGSRIDIGRSLAIARGQKPTATSPQAAPALQENTSSKDAASVQLSKPTELSAPKPAFSAIPAPVASDKEAAKASYLGQGAAASNSATSDARVSPTTTPLLGASPANYKAEESSPPIDDFAAAFAELRQRLTEPDTTEYNDTPAGDTKDELRPHAEKYVAFLIESGEQYSPEQRSAKVNEVVEFYSMPNRKGRLQALVQEF